jgi:long-chain acyl-CoA synthetase
MSTRAEIEAELSGPGGRFEVVTEVVDGVEMKVYRDRLPHLRAIAEIAARRSDDRTFIVHGDRRIGFGEFFRTVNSVSAGLAAHGVGRGDRVAVLSANNPEWALTFWGTVDLGGILVGLNGWWKADEILYGLQDSGAKVLVADGPRLARVIDRVDECPALEAVFEIPDPPNPARPVKPAVRESTAGPTATPLVGGFGELLDAEGVAFPDGAIDEGDPAVILYTSGTTGKPKGAVSTHRSMIASLQNTVYKAVAGAMIEPAKGTGERADTVSLLTVPLFHVAGCHSTMVVGTLAGVRLVMLDGKFTPEKALDLIERERVTVWGSVPTMVQRVCDSPALADHDTSTVTNVSFGGSPSAEELRRKVLAAFPNVTSTGNAYGLTESSSVATLLTGDDAARKPDSVGLPMPVVDIQIVSPDGEVLPSGQTGEIQIKGPIIMPGYWGKPEATAQSLTDGWLHTGDVGHVDDDGFLFITDRAKDVIIRGGENIYSAEIENRLVEHPDIVEGAVFGVPHAVLGEEVKAVVCPRPGATITEDDVRTWVRETLADFKVPTQVELRTEPLPRNPSGKLLKQALRSGDENSHSFEETL